MFIEKIALNFAKRNSELTQLFCNKFKDVSLMESIQIIQIIL